MITEPPAEEKTNPGDSTPPTPPDPQAEEVHFTLALPPGARVQITIEALPENPGGADSAAGEPEVLIVAPEAQEIVGGGPVPTLRMEGGRNVAVTLHRDLAGAEPAAPVAAPDWRRAISGLWARLQVTPAVLFTAALLVYLAVRLIGLEDFPIYFFTDEAVQTVLAADLVRDGFRDYEQVLLPTYFKNGTQYNLSVSVYLQVLPYLVFGNSVFVTRMTSVLVTLLAAAGVGLNLREFFHLRYWWVGPLLLSATPAWFLHSRTAFETVLMVSFYTAALYCYLLYRCRSPHYLYACLVLAALAFYSYSPGQVVVVLTGLALLLVDAPYHWQNRDTVLRGALLGILLALPYLRFRFLHPTAVADHLRNLSSYWVQPVPLEEKLSRFASEYFYGLSPGYWFLPNERDLARHRFDGSSHLLRISLPFFLGGLILALKNLRSPAQRLALIAALAAPAGGALAQIGITRVLVFVIPATLFTSSGLDWALTWLERRLTPRLSPVGLQAQAAADPPIRKAAADEPASPSPGSLPSPKAGPHAALALVVFTVLALMNFGMMREALDNGPTWFRDYGLGGMQYGARQVFGEVSKYLQENPGAQVIVSPAWANGTDVVARFFFHGNIPFQMGSVVGHLEKRRPLTPETLFVMIPEEFEQARTSGKFKQISVEKIIPYPDGNPGFYFTHLEYVDSIDEILAEEQAARRVLVSGEVRWQGQLLRARHSPLDIGEIGQAFDGDRETVIRSAEANPLVIELTFERPVEIGEVYLKFGSAQIVLTTTLQLADGARVVTRSDRLVGTVSTPDATIDLGERLLVESLRLEVRDPHQEDFGHIHVWEIEFR